jgi:hypothetical protein
MNDNPYYSLENFLIKINFVMSEIKEEDPDSIEQLGQIIHEYTHYLQSLTTIYGISVLTTYLDLLIKITIDVYGEIAHGQVNIDSIIEKYRDDFSRISKRLHWKRTPRNFNVQRDRPDYFFKQMSNPNISGKQTEEFFLYNIYDHQYYHISTSVLRENMAMMAFFYAHGIG